MVLRPSGTVTFLFSDIQGSTKLWEERREAMDLALKRHDELMRQAIEAHHGYVFKTVGDAFCVAFASAIDAVAASVQAQLLLDAEDWGQTPIRVRMGLHTGEAHKREGDYFGPTLNRTARLMSIGHGGQVLLSQATHELLLDTLPPDLSLQDLGFHRLKDLAQPEHIYQLLHPELTPQFPDLNSLSYLASNLPVQPTSFIGRESDIEKVFSLLKTAHLVTLTGIGGTGKTRLSLQVAADLIEQYADGVWFVELAPLVEPTLVANAIASVLKISGVPNQTMVQTLKEHLKQKELLLVLDNCEHLVEACAIVADELLKTSPKLRILASSREALEIAGEQVYPVSPLPLPEATGQASPSSLMQVDSVQLFVERAKSVKLSFGLTEDNAEAVGFICRTLDGIPLALELAAARLQMMTAQKLAEMIEDRFRLLTAGKRSALPHHQTLRATIDWSYDLLDESEKILLNRLSVFRGGLVLEAAEGVCALEPLSAGDVLDHLSQLVQKSLVEVDQLGPDFRYRLLETVRQYGAEKLEEAGEADRLSEAHLNYFLELAEEAEPQLREAKQVEWIKRLETEHENLRLALGWALGQGKAEEAQKLGGALSRFWSVRGHLTEGREWLRQALKERESVSKPAQAKALRWAGNLARLQGAHAEARMLLAEALAIFQELGDKWGVGVALGNLGIVSWQQGDHERARGLYEESMAIFRELGNKPSVADVLNSLAIVAREQGDHERARGLLEESLAIHRELGNKQGVAIVLSGLGNVASVQRDHERARGLLEKSLAIFRELGDKPSVADVLNSLAIVAQEQGDHERARGLLEESLAIHRELGNKPGVAIALSGLGNVAVGQEDVEAAHSYFNESLLMADELGDRLYIVYGLSGLAWVLEKNEQWVFSAQLQGACSRWLAEMGAVMGHVEQTFYDKTTLLLKEALGTAGYLAAFEKGKLLSLEQAKALALDKDLGQSHPDSVG